MSKPRAYEGGEPYVFVSYAHKDSNKVLPIVSALQQQGMRVWYDAGIEVGTEWPEYIAQHLKKCAVCMAFISRESLDSFNCRREINFAIAQRKELLAVYLEDVNDEMPLGMQMQLGSVQGVFYNRHASMASFVDTVCTSTVMLPCGNGHAHSGFSGPAKETAPARKKGWNPFARNRSDAAPDIDVATAIDIAAATKTGLDLYKQGRYTEAVKYLQISAESGFSDTQTLLGLCYSNGNGVAKNHYEAVKWYRKAAAQNDELAQTMLGMCYILGNGVAEDVDEGIRLLQEAAARGGEEAQNLLNELGISAAPSSAASDVEATYQIGREYYNNKDYTSALPYLARAGELEHPEALYLLAMCYLDGKGVEEDYTSAYMLMDAAARKGSVSARKFMKNRNPLGDPFDIDDNYD